MSAKKRGADVHGTRSTVGSVRENVFQVPHICVDTEKKMRRALKPYIGREFHIREGRERKISPTIERDTAVLRGVYSHCALFETTGGQGRSSTVFGSMYHTHASIRFSATLSTVARYYRPVRIIDGHAWPMYDGDSVEEEEEV